MDLRDLRYFLAVANEGSTRRAAQFVHRTQPAIVKAIERLEGALSANLFERDGRGQRLTTAGLALLARGQSLLDAAEALHVEIGALGRGTAGRVRIGSGHIGAEYLMPALAAMMLREAPEISIEMTVQMNYVLRERLRAGTLDVIVGYIPDEHGEFVSERLLNDVLVLAVRDKHPLLDKTTPSLHDLTAFRWALPNASVSSRQWLNHRLEAHGVPHADVQVETDSNAILRDVVARTDLLSFISRRLIANSPSLRELPMPLLHYERGFGLTYALDRTMSPASRRTIALLREQGESLFDGPMEEGWAG